MPAWIHVYCARTLEQFTAAELVSELERADLSLAAEVYGITDEALVRAAEAHLRLELVACGATATFDLYYQPPASRPLSIHRCTALAEIQELVDEEVNEWLADAAGPGADQVRAHLARVREVVSIELGFSQLKDMGIVIADEVARWIAMIGDGYIKDVDDVWLAIDEWNWKRLYPLPEADDQP